MENSKMNRYLHIALSLPVLLAAACDTGLETETTAFVEPDDRHDATQPEEPEEPEEPESAVDPELEALTCLTRDGEPGPTPARSRGLTEPRYRIDESEGMSPESLTAPPPTAEELDAARRFSTRFVADDGTLRSFSAVK